MNIRLRINGVWIAVEVSEEVYQFLALAKRKEENLHHEQRRHWEQFAFNETCFVVKQGVYAYTPEQWFLRRERLEIIYDTLMQCTPTQRRRFLLHALEGMSYAEIARLSNCSKMAVRESIEAVRKKLKENLK